MNRLPADLRKSNAYPGTRPDDVVAFIETHISWVFLVGGDVYKVKKPVDLGYVDFSSLEKRRAACEAELTLNRRLAPDVYLGLVPVSRTADGPLCMGRGEEVVDWAVHMRRLPDGHRADSRLARGALTRDDVGAIAAWLADFHAQLPPVRGAHILEQLRTHVQENLHDLEGLVDHALSATELEGLKAAQLGFLTAHRSSFVGRLEAGRTRDGHGDLRLEHIYLDEGDDGLALRVIDCVEFSDEYRVGDVCADMAFAAMELLEADNPSLAEHLMARYARDANDYGLYAVLDFYIGYRACVRSKIMATRAQQQAQGAAKLETYSRKARRLALLALAAARPPVRPPFVIAVGGLIAAGKSTVAKALAEALRVPIVDADRTRKYMAGARPTEAIHNGVWQGTYSQGFSDKVYAEVFSRGASVLSSGRGVVLDASFRRPTWREDARLLAANLGVPFLFVECRAPVEALRARLVERSKHASVSDGRLEILDDFAASYEAPDAVPAECLVQLDTTEPIASCLASVLAAVDRIRAKDRRRAC